MKPPERHLTLAAHPTTMQTPDADLLDSPSAVLVNFPTPEAAASTVASTQDDAASGPGAQVLDLSLKTNPPVRVLFAPKDVIDGAFIGTVTVVRAKDSTNGGPSTSQHWRFEAQARAIAETLRVPLVLAEAPADIADRARPRVLSVA